MGPPVSAHVLCPWRLPLSCRHELVNKMKTDTNEYMGLDANQSTSKERETVKDLTKREQIGARNVTQR